MPGSLEAEVKQKAGGETKNGGSGNNSSSNSSNSNSSYSYDADWYFKVDGISELDIAYYHYYAKYYSWDGRSAERDAKVNEQVDRILANQNDATASAEVVSVEIPVWRLKNGQKVAGTAHVQVLSSVADQVKEILQKSIMDRNSSRSKVLADITGEATEWEAITAWVWPLILTRTQTHR